MHDLVCFHCQQAAEKYLKGVLNEQGRPVPRTHDLEGLLSVLVPTYPQLRTIRRGLKFLFQFAVDARYPGFSATKRQAASALRCAGEVRDACRAVLHLPAPRARRRRSP